MKRTIMMVLLMTVLLSACGTSQDRSDSGPVPSVSSEPGSPTPPASVAPTPSDVSKGDPITGGTARKPVIIGPDDLVSTAVLELDVVIVALDDPSAWKATISPKAAATWQPGTVGEYSTNPSLKLLQAGEIVLTLTKSDGTTRTHTILVTTRNDAATSDESEARTVAASLIGMTEIAASERLEANGLVLRVVVRDGESFPATMDYNPQRVNLTIVGDIVKDATIG